MSSFWNYHYSTGAHFKPIMIDNHMAHIVSLADFSCIQVGHKFDPVNAYLLPHEVAALTNLNASG